MALIIAVARFNELTYEENKKYRTKSSFNCIYGFDKEISTTIPYGSTVHVIEMNNTTNEIMGIGKIKNVLKDENRRRIYENENYNRYVYNGKDRIDRLELLNRNTEIIENLERILFTLPSKIGNGKSKAEEIILPAVLFPIPGIIRFPI